MAKDQQARALGGPSLSRSLRALLLQESKEDSDHLLELLRKAGFDVVGNHVSTEASFLERLLDPWDVILADYNIPHFSALAALKVLRQRGIDLPFIIVSAGVGDDTAVGAMKAGARDVIRKEKLSRLPPTIERELNEVQLRRERQEAHEKLRQAEERYRLLIDSVKEHAIFMLDSAGHIQSWNESATRVTGYPESDAIGMSFDLLFPADDASRQRTLHYWQKARSQGSASEEGLCVRLDGSTFFAEHSLHAIHDAQFPGFAMIVRDVTERRQLEEQLRQAQHMEAVGRLAGGVAHDFNNLLSVILGQATIAQAFVTSDSPLLSCLVDIQDAAERAARLTRQLLAVSRRQVLQPSVVNLSKVVADSEPMLRHLLGDNRLVLDLGTDLGHSEVDLSQLDQVLLNLVVNARDAMARQGTLTITTRNASISDGGNETLPAGDYVSLSVRDTGEGIDADVLRHIFEPFFTTKPQGQGTGLGLATVYGAVQQHGGHVRVQSTKGQGATFTVYFPRVWEDASATPAAQRRISTYPRQETVLVVEDEAMVRRLAAQILRSAGYLVLEAETPDIALEVLATRGDGIDLLLTDVMMPHMNGAELARRARAQKGDLRVLYMSGYEGNIVQQEGATQGGLHFLHKPFSVKELEDAVCTALDSHQ